MRRLLPIFVGLLVLVAVTPARAAFPGQNGKLAYSILRCSPSCVQNLYLINPDGTGRTPLTSTAARDATPAWSPDGTKIAFSSNRDDPSPATCSSCNYEIYVMNADGTGAQRLTFAAGQDSSPAWSPDGSKIAFHRSVPGSTSVYVINADGSGETLLAQSGSSPAWSPDGSTIAFSRGGIWLMGADGGNQRMLTTGHEVPECEFPEGLELYNDSGPDWSPNGEQITYLTFILASCNDGDAAYAIRTINADGSDIRQIWHVGEGCAPGSPAWSPDGAKIAFAYCDLMLMNPDGTARTTIDSTCCGIGGPDWQPLSNRPPDCTGVTADPGVLWPPTGRYRVVELSGATDPDSDAVTLEITGVTQDEPVRGARDALGVGDNLVRLRAEREPRGDGRVYQVAFTVTDEKGAECEGTAAVGVPRHGRRPAIDSAPPSYDSFGR